MAIAAQAFSPKEFKVAIVSDATDAGATGIGSTMHQLDVDSVSFPTLNVNQVLDVRSGTGRTFKDEDFFQDNVMRVTELSISGTLHNDTGHKLLLQNICNDVSGDAAVASGFTAASQVYGENVTNAASSLTVVIQPSDVSHQRGIELFGCVVTNFSISAEAGTEGGRYKFSATLQTGKTPDLNSTATPTITAYANDTHSLMSSASGLKVMNNDVTMNSFTCTLDNPAVFTGVTSTGYEVVSRAAEMAVTVDTQVKYDNNTKTLVTAYDTQSGPTTSNSFVMTNNNAFGIAIDNAVYTNVAYSEGDIMMLDISLKSVDDGTDALVTFDISA
tara:strand:+ start:258 stop:1247 length:990 start_codon:yes stop_codon:yes gene_type:complete